MRKVRGEHLVVLTLALARTAFCFYRASHQSIVLDEAYTYNRYLDSWRDVYWLYETNNHVLYSILAKLSIQLFGLSELTIRLPSVIAGFFLVWGAFRVLELAVSRPVRWIALLAISLHPLMMDFSVAARGYGLSIALLIWAVYFAMKRSNALAGVLAALAISANLTVIPAAIGLILAIVLLEKGPVKERMTALAMFAAPFQAVLIAFNLGALRSATLQNFSSGFGHANWQDSVSDLVHNSIHTAHRSGIFGYSRAEPIIVFGLLPLVMIFCIAACFFGDHSKSTLQNLQDVRWIPALTLFVAITTTVAIRHLLGLNYPEDRLGLYLMILFGIMWAIAADSANNPWIRGSQIAMAVLLIAQFATQFELHFFTLWKYDMESRAVAARIKEASKGRAEGSMTVSTTWLHQPSMEFYRVALNIRALRPIEWPRETEFTGYDFYVFNAPDTSQIANHGIRVVFEDKPSGIALGVQ